MFLFQLTWWPDDSEPGWSGPPSSILCGPLLRGAGAPGQSLGICPDSGRTLRASGVSCHVMVAIVGADDIPEGRAGSQHRPVVENLLSLPSNGLFPSTVPQMACPKPSTWSSGCPTCDRESPQSHGKQRETTPYYLLFAHPSLTALFHLSAPGWASKVAQTVKNLPAMRETQVGSLDQEDPLGRATWEMPRTQDPGGLQSMGVTDHHTQLSI